MGLSISDTRAGTTMVAWTGFSVGVATLIAITAPASPAIRLPLVLAFACLGPGSAVVAHLRLADRVAALALALILSLALFVGASAVLAWAGWWHPQVGVIVLAAATALSCGTVLGMRALTRLRAAQDSQRTGRAAA